MLHYLFEYSPLVDLSPWPTKGSFFLDRRHRELRVLSSLFAPAVSLGSTDIAQWIVLLPFVASLWNLCGRTRHLDLDHSTSRPLAASWAELVFTRRPPKHRIWLRQTQHDYHLNINVPFVWVLHANSTELGILHSGNTTPRLQTYNHIIIICNPVGKMALHSSVEQLYFDWLNSQAHLIWVTRVHDSQKSC